MRRRNRDGIDRALGVGWLPVSPLRNEKVFGQILSVQCRPAIESRVPTLGRPTLADRNDSWCE